MAAVGVFDWLQGACFYRAMHHAASDLLPDGEGCTWLDAGCGPGLLTRIAARKGYRATGIDRDPSMVARAGMLARKRGSTAEYRVSDLSDPHLSAGGYDVVSASSLLVVASDPVAMLGRLVALAKPGGRVLIIEAAPGMSRRLAFKAVFSGGLGPRSYMLLAWAAMRAGRTLPEAVFHQAGRRARCFPLLGGLVHAWLIEA